MATQSDAISMMCMLAKLMPEDMIIEELGDALAKYKEATMLNKSEEETEMLKSRLCAMSLMALIAFGTEGNAFDLISDINKASQVMEMMNPKKQ